ncbi:MAG: hypothetical protein DCC65_17610 [Planctomycetota bacterium]|nr:MAG: hypothetical protein DCC65_17610 [Planctomycetota bacterium]
MRAEDLLDRLEDRPFKPFRIHLSDGTMLTVPNAGMVIVGRSSVVLPSKFERDSEGRMLARHWRTISLLHVVQFSDLDERSNGRRRRKA